MTPAEEFNEFSDPYTVDVEPEVPARTSRRLRLRRTRGELITDARHTHEQNIRSRERNYMLLQSLRIPFILLSMLAAWYWENWWLAGLLFVVSIPLPWIAVMVGNGQGEKRDPRQKNVYKPAPARAAEPITSAGAKAFVERDEADLAALGERRRVTPEAPPPGGSAASDPPPPPSA